MSASLGVGDTFGRYEIVRRIGRGGMGTVFEARQLDLGRAIALKVLSPELAEDPDFRARFAREARMLAALDSPHVIQVFDSGEHQGEFFIATQLVHGRDLLQLLRESGPLPPAAALRVVGQVASALADAHDAGVLHRDVKPSNVLIRETRADYFAYLCDFGIARHTESTHTRTGGVLGTLSYLAPECHEGADASVGSDLYSLGCVFWAALTGRAPYEGTSEYQVALAHMREEIPTYDGDSPAAFEINAILRRSMAKRPAERFDSAGTMHAALIQAEEIARGLRRDGRDVTSQRAAPDSDKTQLRVAQHAGSGAVGAVNTGRASRRRRSFRVLAVWAAALVALVALGGTAAALLRHEDPVTPAARAQPPKSSAKASAEPSPSPRAKPHHKVHRPPVALASSTPSPSTSSPAPVADSSASLEGVVCWDSSTAPTARLCPVPAGRRGLESVFPSMDDVCAPVGTGGVLGKAEVFECRYGSYLIRYSRWDKGADRYGYFNVANPGATHPKWYYQGLFYGRAWVSYEDSANEPMKYQWSATYRGSPFSVSVEGVDAAARDTGVQRVAAVRPGRVGVP